MAQKHRNLCSCPKCKGNITSVFSYTDGAMKKLDGYGACPRCRKIYQIKVAGVV